LASISEDATASGRSGPAAAGELGHPVDPARDPGFFRTLFPGERDGPVPPSRMLLDTSQPPLARGEMADRIRAFDWSTTPLGPAESWSPALRMMVRFLLANRFPLLLWWGPRYVSLYNDAYRPILGTKHPWALGRPVDECWSEIWHVLEPLIDTPYRGGPATWNDDIFLELNRHGFVEETHFTIAYSPVPDDTVPGGIGGVLATVHEITEKVIGERRVVALRDLGARIGQAKTAEEAAALAAETLARHDRDVPFVLVYLLAPDGSTARLAGHAGVEPGRDVSPTVVDLAAVDGRGWPLGEARRTETMVVVEPLHERFATVPAGPWADPPDTAVVVPVGSSRPGEPAALVVAGISARLRWDESYRGFFELLSTQVATAIANARAYEEEKRRAEALAELDRAKTIFFSNVSHEFRTPLTLILGPLEDALAEAREPSARERLASVHRNALRLQKLVNTLLDFSRIEAGRIQASFQPTDLAALTSELASVFRSAVEKAGMRLVVDCPPLDEPVWVDREMYEKIVLNLLSNAFKFTLEGEIDVHVRDAGAAVELSVRDTGAGIAAHDLPHVFERFHRIAVARARTHEGTGIGLAFVHELVKLHGGRVGVASVPGEGSTFTVTLPKGATHLPADRIGGARTLSSTALGADHWVEEALGWLPGPASEGPLVAATAVAAAGASRARIVWADDNADMREYVAGLLAPCYDVEAVADGEAALAAVRRTPPDLVLADVMMPRLDGFGLLRALRGEEETQAVPVILLSARAGEEARVEGLGAGADDYLVKPFTARELHARVESHVRLARLRRESAAALREREERIAADLEAMTRLQHLGNVCAAPGSDLARCLDEIVATAIAITGADKATLQLLDASGVLTIAAQHGFDRPFLDFFARVSRDDASACGAAPADARRVVVDDVRRRDVFRGHPSERMLLEAGVLAVQSTPLTSSDGTVLGMVSTHWAVPHRPGERELRLLDLLARQAADFLVRRRAEEALREADRRKDEFLAMLAHELRNPLAPISNALHVLQIAGGDRELVEATHDMIARQVEHMVRLVDDLLEVSRITLGKIAIRKERIDLRDVVRSALETTQPLFDAARHRLTTELPPEPVILDADPVRLAQVLSNLLANAAKYTEADGLVSLAARSGPGGVVISVRDSGVGIPAEMLPKIFELFTQVDRPYDRSRGGLGIGLTLVRSLVEMHGGTVEARSDGPGKGSEFVVRLPVADPLSVAPAPRAERAPTIPAHRILVVDDNRDAAESLGMLLTVLGADVHTVHDGAAALEALATYRPSVMLLDIGMPGMDGYEVARRARQQRDGDPLTVIALTGWGQEEDCRRSREAGIDHHLVKPVDIEVLEALLAAPGIGR
jgi:signal transduction histidine kinase